MTKKWKDDFLHSRKYAQIMRMMKFYVLFMLFGMLHTYGSVHSQSLTLNVENASLKEVFREIEKNSDYRFLFKSDDVVGIKGLTLSVSLADIDNVMALCLKGTRLVYEKDGSLIIIKRGQEDNQPKKRIVKGKILDEKGESLPGATIVLKGTALGGVANVDGTFTLEIPQMDTTVLLVTFVGYQMQEVALKKNNNKELIVRLKPDVTEIEEVVITGYGKVDKRLSASATTSVKIDDILIPNVASVDAMLQGRVPGLMVMTTSGSPNATPKMRIRGSSTIHGNAAPIWVVDGIIYEDPVDLSNDEINDVLTGSASTMREQAGENASLSLLGNAISGVNPMDIESITFLKDASATAIYGTQAANGVIVVTTKKGKVGKPSVTFSASFGFTERPRYSDYQLMNSKERIGVSRETAEYGYLYGAMPYSTGYEGALFDYYDGKITKSEFDAKVADLETMNTDWFKILCQNAFNQDYTLSVSGGNETSRYYFSVGYNNSKGTTKGDNLERYNLNLNLSTEIGKFVNVEGKLSFSDRKSDGFYMVNPSDYALSASRAISKDEFYTTQYSTVPGLSSNFPLSYNILNEIDHTGNEANIRQVNASVGMNAKLHPRLTLNTLFGVNYSNTVNKKWADERSYYIAEIRGYDYGAVTPNSEEEKASRLSKGGILLYETNNNISYTARAQLSYNKILNENHIINAMVGYEVRSVKNDGFNTEEWGYFPDRGLGISYEYDTNTSGSTSLSGNSSLEKHTAKLSNTLSNTLSGFATLVYAYRNRYVLNANIRMDASNRFGQYTNNKALPVWSVAGRWSVSEEPWFKLLGERADLSLRLSYGSQGNVPTTVGPNLVVKYPTTVINRWSGEYVLNVSRYAYPDLRWEKTKTINIGTDFSFWKGRISGTIDYYYKKGKDIIFSLDVPAEYGVKTTYKNGADIKNTGFELAVSFVPVQTKDFKWTITPTYSKNTNNVQNTGKNEYTYTDYLAGNAFENGKPVNAVYSWKFTGLDPQYGYATFAHTSRDQSQIVKMDDPKDYLVYSGQADPKISGGFTTSLRYKNLTLNANFAYSLGSVKRLNFLYSGALTMPAPQDNLHKDLLKRWKKPGDELTTNIPGFVFDGSTEYNLYVPIPSTVSLNSYEMYNYSDIRVVKGDFLRCRNLSLSYTIPQKYLKKFGVSMMSCMFNVTNPLTICSSKFRGQDPEQGGTGGTALPITQTYSFSLNVSF